MYIMPVTTRSRRRKPARKPARKAKKTTKVYKRTCLNVALKRAGKPLGSMPVRKLCKRQKRRKGRQQTVVPSWLFK